MHNFNARRDRVNRSKEGFLMKPSNATTWHHSSFTKTPFKISCFYCNTYYLLNIYNNTIYCQPCQHFTDTLVHRFVPIIKYEDFTLVVMTIISFLPSSTTAEQRNHVPILALTTKLGSGHNSMS